MFPAVAVAARRLAPASGSLRRQQPEPHAPGHRAGPGGSVRGALVFRPTGGNRPITLRISLDGGTTWGEWQTNLGVF